jgi:diguanylate cyclase (GGDEF)-like protein
MATELVGGDDTLRLDRVQALARVGFWEWDPATGHMHWSTQLRRILGFGVDEEPDFTTLRSLVHPDDLAAFDDTVTRAPERGCHAEHIHRSYLADRRTVRVLHLSLDVVDGGEGIDQRVFATCMDITEQQEAKNELAYLATHDTLSGLHNRRSIVALLEERLTDAPADRGALLLIDIDHFKDINDTRGHGAGDEVLTALTTLLGAQLPPEALLGRLGGDEFAVILPGGDTERACAVAEQLCDAVYATPIATGKEPLRMSVSIGVAALADAGDAGAALTSADLALYQAKADGRNTVRSASHDQRDRASQRLSIQQRLSRALDADRLRLLAQPIVDLATDQVLAHELLLRVDDEHEPPLLPGTFLPTAERSTLAARIDRWVLDRAITALATPAARRRRMRLQVNLTGRSLRDADLADRVIEQLRSAGVAPHRLGLEVTEFAAINDTYELLHLIERLSAAGCPVVMDDFGSGLGSLLSLRHVPFAAVKLSGPLIAHADRNDGTRTVVDGLVRMAKGLRMHVIAEEVDSMPLLRALRDSGVRAAQGYLLGRPEPLERVLAG